MDIRPLTPTEQKYTYAQSMQLEGQTGTIGHLRGEAGFTDEKEIAAMTMDDILSMQGITVADITLINDLQKSIKSNKVISFLGGGAE